MEWSLIVGVGIVALGFIAGWSPLGLLNRATAFSETRATRDVPYGRLPRQRLDLYRAPEVGPRAPVVIFFYGGSWQRGDKADYPFVGDAFTAQGFLTLVPDYRVYPEVKFPAFVEDGAQVVRWALDHAAEFGGDPERIYLLGHSAGAHIAALLALDESYLKGVGLDRSAVRAVVGFAGPYDFLPFRSETMKTLFGPPDGWPTTQPINFVDGHEPPMLLLAAARDSTVSPGNTRRLAARICERGGEARAIIYRQLGHVSILGVVARPLRWVAPVLRDTVSFLREH